MSKQWEDRKDEEEEERKSQCVGSGKENRRAVGKRVIKGKRKSGTYMKL